MESKEYSWAFVTADRLLKQGPCELLYAYLVPSGASTVNYIRDGVDANGDLIVSLVCAVVTGHEFKPPVPVFCNKGLWIDIGTNTTGIFVMWRNL